MKELSLSFRILSWIKVGISTVGTRVGLLLTCTNDSFDFADFIEGFLEEALRALAISAPCIIVGTVLIRLITDLRRWVCGAPYYNNIFSVRKHLNFKNNKKHSTQQSLREKGEFAKIIF